VITAAYKDPNYKIGTPPIKRRRGRKDKAL
jgi:hypothetical protein